MRWRRVVVAIVIATISLGARRRAVQHPSHPPLHLDLARSFVVTDPVILESFAFARVLDALATRSGVDGLTGEKLFRQWMDAQNPKPGLDASMPHCDDEIANGRPAMNGFERRCPHPDGALATAPYDPARFTPLAIVNRFDLTDPNGAHCGQYRVLYAMSTPGDDDATFRVIFEAGLSNPQPQSGLAGCRGVAEFWASLSAVDSITDRRASIERFFFDGISGYAPAIHPDHFRQAQAGIRTIQLSRGVLIGFFQYRIEGGVVKPDLLENIPSAELFDASVAGDRGRRFRAEFLEQLDTLAIRDVNLYHWNVPAEFLVGDLAPRTGKFAFAFGGTFNRSQQTLAGQAFYAEIAQKLRAIGSTLTPQQAVLRAETQSCVGCHFSGTPVGEGVEFPASTDGLVHVAKDRSISPAMKNVFVPHRMQILRDFLATGKAPVHSN